MNEIPLEIRHLAEQRERARRGRDFTEADSLRERIRDEGFDVADTAGGPRIFRTSEAADHDDGGESDPIVRPDQIIRLLDDPPGFDASVHWIVEGWPGDVVRGIESFRRVEEGRRSVQHVVVDTTGGDRSVWPPGVDVVRLAGRTGWAAGRNAGFLRAAGEIVVIVDGSIEAAGDVLGPLSRALDDPTVGLTGPFGLVTEDLRQFRPAPGPECDAVEGYLMAVRRSLLQEGLRFDQKFRFYRIADIELSFQIKAKGLRVTITSVPVNKHEHRMWANTPEDRRAQLSKRNFYRFLDR